MASVDGSGKSGSSQADTAGQLREEYRKRMYEQEVRHRRELRDIVSAHAREVEDIKAQSASKESILKEKTQTALTKRDSQYRSQVDQLRKIHQEQVERMADESSRKTKNIRSTLTQQLEKERSVADQQKKMMAENQEAVLRQKEASMQSYVSDSRDAQNKAREEQRLKLTEKHKMEKEALVDYHEQKQQALQRNLKESDLRRQRDVANVEQTMQRKMSNVENNLRTQLESEESRNQKTEQLLREGFNEGLDTAKERQRASYEKRMAASEEAQSDFRSNINNRIEGRMAILERDLAIAEKGRSDDSYVGERRHKLEKDHLSSAFQDQVEDLQRQREQAVNQFNDKMKETTYDINRNKDKLFNYSLREFQDSKHKLELRHQERYDTKVAELETLRQHEAEQAESRVDRIVKHTDRTVETMGDKYEDTVAEMKDYYLKKMQDQREQLLGERDATIKQLRDQATKDRKKAEEKLVDAESHFKNEKELMAARHQEELKRLENVQTLRVEEMEKLSKMGRESEISKYEARIKQLRENHQDEVNRMNRRHQEELTKFAVTSRYTQS